MYIFLEDVPIILADIKDEESLKKMTERAKVLINCCGPYRFYGESVVKACIATRTHYVDVTGEEQVIQYMFATMCLLMIDDFYYFQYVTVYGENTIGI